MPMDSARCTRGIRAGGHRSSRWRSGGRSRRSPNPGPLSTACRFSTWSLSKLAEFLVAEGVVDDISHEGLRMLLREEGVTFQRLKTWKASADPDYAAKKARVEHLYAIADRSAGGGNPGPGAGDGEHHHRHRARRAGGAGDGAGGPVAGEVRGGGRRPGEHAALGAGDARDLR